MLSEICEFTSGYPLSRIIEVQDVEAPSYFLYGQAELQKDLNGHSNTLLETRKILTWDKVKVLESADVVFGLLSGTATVISSQHSGYLFTQNYIKLILPNSIDSQFLVYMLNENKFIKKQLQESVQGSSVLKYTLAQLKGLRLPDLPPVVKQKIIGDVYFKQKKLQTLRCEAAEFESMKVLGMLEKETAQ